jgi:phosphoserine phosphatase RsbU/P
MLTESDTSQSDPPPKPLQGVAVMACSEVWGGNGAADTSLVLPGLEGGVVSRPHRNAASGGDVHFVSSCGTGRITRVMLVDVSGHGEPAANVAEFLRRTMQRYVNHIAPNKLAADLNQRLSTSKQRAGRFATAIIMTFFSPTGDLNLCNAGHPPPMLYRQATRRWSCIDRPTAEHGVINLPLGVLEESGYIGREVRLNPGDVILAYTDCLIEAIDADGRQLGVTGLTAVLNQIGDPGRHRQPGSLSSAMLGKIESHGYHMDDDLTILVLRCTERSEGATTRMKLAAMGRDLRRFLREGLVPWPELSVRNVGGAFISRLSHYRSGRSRS